MNGLRVGDMYDEDWKDIYPEVLAALSNPRDYMMHCIRREMTKSTKPGVKHQQTCPVCGRNLVNTYYLDGEWKCRRCLNCETGEEARP